MDFSQINNGPQIKIDKKQPRQNPHKKSFKFKSLLNQQCPTFLKYPFLLVLPICILYFIISIIIKSKNITTLKSNILTLSQKLQITDNESITKLKNDTSVFNILTHINQDKFTKLIETQKEVSNLIYKSHQNYEDVNYGIVQTETDIKKNKEDCNLHQQKISELKSEIAELKEKFFKKQNDYDKLCEKYSGSKLPEPSSESHDNVFDIKYITSSKNPSRIIEDEDQYELLNRWIYSPQRITYGLLYRASRDGLIAENFHRLCNDKQIFNSLVIIQSIKGEIFGGYTYGNWAMNGFREDKGAFLFNVNKKQKYKVKEFNRAVYGASHLLATFGNGDLTITEKGGISNFPVSYEGNNFELTNGEQNFQIKEMEVFNLGLVRDY